MLHLDLMIPGAHDAVAGEEVFALATIRVSGMTSGPSMKGAIIIVLLGPGEREFRRFNDLIASLVFFEREFAAKSTLLIVNDRNDHLDRDKLQARANFLRITAVDNPYVGRTGGELIYDRCTAGMLLGLRMAADAVDHDFVLKLDTDAVVCAGFADRIAEFFLRHPRSGMIGSLSHDPDGSLRGTEEWWARWIRGTCGVFPKHWIRLQFQSTRRGSPVGAIQRWYRRNRLFRRALRSKWRCGASILGGAYAISPEAVRLLRVSAYLLDDIFCFECARMAEDVAVSIVVAALGLTLDEYNREGEVFAIWYQKPSLPLAEIVRRRYGLVHSIKATDSDEEREMRAELAHLAQMPHDFRIRMQAFLS